MVEKKSFLLIDIRSTETRVLAIFSGVWPPGDTITLVLYNCCRVCCLTWLSFDEQFLRRTS